MAQDSKDNAAHTPDNGSPASAEPSDGDRPGKKTGKYGKIEKKLAGVSTVLKEEVKAVSAEAEDLVKHPKRCAELGASLAESVAGDSLGEVVGGAIGSVLGPEGTVIGAEMGSIAGQVFGARQGDQLAKILLHDGGAEAPLKEDVQRVSSAEASGKMGKKIGGLIGDALFDDGGAEIGEAVGDVIGELAGETAYENVKKKHVKNQKKSSSDPAPPSNKDAPQK